MRPPTACISMGINPEVVHISTYRRPSAVAHELWCTTFLSPTTLGVQARTLRADRGSEDESMRRVALARDMARKLLVSQPGRLAHSEAVGHLAEEMSPRLVSHGRESFVAAAYLHDIGYAPEVETTGFHPLDGALYLSQIGFADVAGLVAHHSGSEYEAELRGVEAEMRVFAEPDEQLLDALTYCDMNVSPGGERVSVTERIAEIVERYEEGHPAARAVQFAEPILRTSIARVLKRLEAQAGL